MHFSKPLSLFVLSLVATALPLTAGPIDMAQARQNALQFCQSHAARSSARKAPAAASALQHVYTQYTPDGRPALYVFNTSAQGYVIAAADDEAKAVVGYSTEGAFDPAEIPESMTFLLDLYAAEIATLNSSAASAAAPQRSAARASSVGRIEPLLGAIEWDQMPPYNLLCPMTVGGNSNGQYNGGHAATGCMTTALAQIMRYHKHPAHGYGSIEHEVKEGLRTELWSVDLYDDYYHWDSMGDNKNGFARNASGSYDTADPGVDGVSKLMRDLGLALRTIYGPASSAVSTRIIPALINYFDYDAKSIALVKRRTVGDEEFERQLLDELQDERPVYLDGLPNATTAGHAFVCDGYDGDGLFHINWGWSGQSNGFFSLSGLDPKVQGTGSTGTGYNYDLVMVKGIKPRPEGQEPFVAHPLTINHGATRPGTFTYPGIWVAHADDTQNIDHLTEFALSDAIDYWLAAELGLPSGANMDLRARYGVLVVKPNGERELAWDKDGEPTMLFNNYGYYKFRVNFKESWKQPGTRIYYIYSPCAPASSPQEPHLLYNGEGLLSSFCIVEKDGQALARIDRTEPSVPLDFTPTEVVQREPYFSNGLSFDYDLDAPRPNERLIGSIGVRVVETGKETAFAVDGRKMYRNMTDDAVFRVPAGSTIKPFVTMDKGNWMHSYFYIDYDHDGYLSCNATSLSQAGTDLAAYSYWTGNVASTGTGYNNASQVVANSNTLDMPAFQAPDTPGTYYVRFKIDWNCVDPAGNVGYMVGQERKNHIVDNGGAIVDARIIVTDPLPKPDPELVATLAAYHEAEADYYAFREEMWMTTNQQAFNIAQRAVMEIDFYVGWLSGTIQQYKEATSNINRLLAQARKEINDVLAPPEPTPDPDPTVTPDVPDTPLGAQLASIYVGAGTTALQLYPEFSPDVHLYLARRSDYDYESPGSSLIAPGTTYTVFGTPADADATATGPIMMELVPGWNRATITCTAADGKTTEQYHIILLSNGSATASAFTPITITDLSLMLAMLQPGYGYTDDSFVHFVNPERFTQLLNQLLKK